MALAEMYQNWLEHDGKKVKIDGIVYKIRVDCYRAIYPYERQEIKVYADVVNKNSKFYRDLKAEYGDDWSTDVLESFEFMCEALRQLEN